MSGIDLGLTVEELRAQVIERAAEKIAESVLSDHRSMVLPVEKLVQLKVDEITTRIADETIQPLVGDMIEKLVFQETNTWGEEKKPPLTWREYLVTRAERYLTEQVSFEGKSKKEDSWGSWKGAQTRVAYMVHQHLHYSIESAMKAAVAEANSKIAQGIQETVKIKLAEIVASLKVNIEAKGR